MRGSIRAVDSKSRWRNGIKQSGKTIPGEKISSLCAPQRTWMIDFWSIEHRAWCRDRSVSWHRMLHHPRLAVHYYKNDHLRPTLLPRGQQKTEISKAERGILWILPISSLYPPHSAVFPWYSTRNAFDLKTRGCCQMTVNIKWKEPWDAASCPTTMWSFNRSLNGPWISDSLQSPVEVPLVWLS